MIRLARAHTGMKKLFLTAVALFLLCCAFSPLALAHAVLLSSMPTMHARVHGPVVAIDLKFNSRVDGSRSRLVLVLANGSAKALVLMKQPSPEELAARAAVTPGAYTVRWQAVAADGHITRGEIPFTVQ